MDKDKEKIEKSASNIQMQDNAEIRNMLILSVFLIIILIGLSIVWK